MWEEGARVGASWQTKERRGLANENPAGQQTQLNSSWSCWEEQTRRHSRPVHLIRRDPELLPSWTGADVWWTYSLGLRWHESRGFTGGHLRCSLGYTLGKKKLSTSLHINSDCDLMGCRWQGLAPQKRTQNRFYCLPSLILPCFHHPSFEKNRKWKWALSEEECVCVIKFLNSPARQW